MRDQKNFFSELRSGQVSTYQKYFQNIIEQVDIGTDSDWAQGRPYDKDQLRKNDKLTALIREEAASDGLSQHYIQMFYYLYIFADPYFREIDQSNWVSRVLNREDPADYFPDPWTLYNVISKNNTKKKKS